MKILSVLLFLFTTQVFAASISMKTLSELKTLDGKSYESNSGQDLKLLYFWATWCPDCKEKMRGQLKEVAANGQFNFLFINTEKDLDLIKNFVQKEQVKFDVYTDFDKTIRKSLKVFSVPQWVLLKKSGDHFEVLGNEAGFDYEKVKSLVAQNLKGIPN